MKLRWSFSHSRTFGRCPRQWFFATQLAKWNRRDPLAREAFLLSKLQSVSAWRGSLVDGVICDEVIPALRTGAVVSRQRVLTAAKERFDRQLDFARNKRWREAGMTAQKAGNSYVALYALEYGEEIEAELETAWIEVEQALTHFLEMSELLRTLRKASQLIPQRSLLFRHSGVNVMARPDLIAIFRSGPPLIIDWKVHTFGAKDYRLQLALYAIALNRCRPHRDFPIDLRSHSPQDIKLFEAQLLTKQLRPYCLTEQDIRNAENYISVTATRMWLAVRSVSNEVITYNEMPVTIFPDTCQRCPFRSICWEEVSAKEHSCQDLRRTSSLF
ncbi:MAG TPA: PD-(D/E)XK nuclease family protein [Pyrinomonadaceae bacterium]|nr:PD-(D/E)XK nuclease family protein [Pyrinomonadaceae bacterium]